MFLENIHLRDRNSFFLLKDIPINFLVLCKQRWYCGLLQQSLHGATLKFTLTLQLTQNKAAHLLVSALMALHMLQIWFWVQFTLQASSYEALWSLAPSIVGIYQIWVSQKMLLKVAHFGEVRLRSGDMWYNLIIVKVPSLSLWWVLMKTLKKNIVVLILKQYPSFRWNDANMF